MAENMIKFLRGNVASLPQTATPGAVYFTKDEGLYLGLQDGTYHRYGDFITVANVASLPSTGAHQTCMYYCEAENILAKWDGTEWVQINKQKTLEQLGGVAKSVYETKMAALEKADTDNATAIDNLSKYVGTIPTDSEATSVIAYVQERTTGIASEGAMTELGNRLTQAEKDIDAIEADYLKAADKTALESKITAAQTAADNAQAAADGVAANLATHAADATHITAAERTAWNGKTTMDEVEAKGYLVAGDIADKADKTQVATDIAAAVKTETDNRVAADDAIKASIGTVAEGKTVVKMIEEAQAAATYNDSEVRGLISGNAEAIAAETKARGELKTELEGKIGEKVAQSTYDTKVAALEGEDVRLAGLISGIDSAYKAADEDLDERIAALESDITGLSGAMHFKGVVEALPETTEGYANGDVLVCGQKEYVVNGEAFVELGDVSSEVQRISDLEGVVGKAAEGENAATGLVKAVADNAAAIASEQARAEGEEAKLAAADATNLQAAKDYADAAVTALNISQYAKDADLETAKGRITTAEGKITALEGASATHATKTEVEAVSTALNEYKTAHASDYTNAQIDSAVKVVADDLKAYTDAHAGDYTNEQINAAIANAGHASASDLATHTGNADIHVTTDDKAKWNAAEQNAKDYADTKFDAAKADASNKDAVVLAEAQNGINAAKSELQGNIDTVSGALNTYKTSNDAAVALKANASDVFTKAEVEAMLTWGDF